jgi:predicted LPLAT superfamily acyltransferase
MTLLDRLFLLAGRHHLFRLEKHGREAMYTLLQQGRGLLLLGAHLGSFELARSFGEASSGVPVNMMMHDNQMQKINRVIASLGLREHMRIIPIGGLDALLAAHERVEQGEMIGMLADRVVSAERAVRVPFLGKEALFPAGPILLANALKVPVVLFFGLYQGGNRYVEHFEVFADQIVLGRATRQADLEVWVRRYVQRLEYFSRLAPYNWFNFFDFWGEHPPAAPAPAAERASSRHA